MQTGAVFDRNLSLAYVNTVDQIISAAEGASFTLEFEKS